MCEQPPAEQPSAPAPADPNLGVKKDVLMAVFNENCALIRHHETQRQLITAGVTTFAGILGGVLTASNTHSRLEPRVALPVSLALMTLGFVGWATADRHYEKARFHSFLANVTLGKLTKLVWADKDEDTIELAHYIGRYHPGRSHELSRKFNDRVDVASVPLHVLWPALSALVFAAGVILVAWSWCEHSDLYDTPALKGLVFGPPIFYVAVVIYLVLLAYCRRNRPAPRAPRPIKH